MFSCSQLPKGSMTVLCLERAARFDFIFDSVKRFIYRVLKQNMEQFFRAIFRLISLIFEKKNVINLNFHF